jgi:stringent starvation protein B
MSEQSAKPYLIRAICEWCADNALTPYLAVKVNGETRVPMAFVKNGEIVLNVSATATRKLTIDNAWVQFSARFNGNSQEVAVPMAAVTGVFAKETGYGFAFAAVPDAVASLAAAAAPKAHDLAADLDQETATAGNAEGGKDAARDEAKPGGKGSPRAGGKRTRPSHLQVIK